MIDELAYAGPEHLDAAFVAGFDRKQGYPDPGEDLDALDRIARMLRPGGVLRLRGEALTREPSHPGPGSHPSPGS